MKKFLIIFFCVLVVSVLFNFVKEKNLENTVVTYQNKDIDSYNKFKKELSIELNNLVEDEADNFLDDLQSVKMIYKSLTFKKEEYIHELYQKHFGNKFEELVNQRVTVLIEDLWNNQDVMFNELTSLKASISPSLKDELRVKLIKNFNEKGYKETETVSNLTFGAAIIASGVASGVASVVTKGMKGNLVTFIIAIIIEPFIENKINKEVKNYSKPKVVSRINNVINDLLTDKNNGLLVEIERNINNYHFEEKKMIMRVADI